jgi:hypothetical protein
MLTLGFDIGLTGAFAAIDEQGTLVALFDLPVMVWGKTKWIDGVHLLGLIRATKNGHPARAFVEQVHAMPRIEKDGQEGKSFKGGGVVAAYSKGLTLGSTLVALQFAGVSIELVSPGTWKRALGLIDAKASDTAKKLASERSQQSRIFVDCTLGVEPRDVESPKGGKDPASSQELNTRF